MLETVRFEFPTLEFLIGVPARGLRISTFGFRISFYFPTANFSATRYGTGSLPKAFKTVPPAVKT